MRSDTRARTALNAPQGWINDESGEVWAQMPAYQERKTLRSRREHPASILVDNACRACLLW